MTRKADPPSAPVPFWSSFSEGSASIALAGASRKEVLAELVDLLVRSGKVDKTKQKHLLGALVAREALGSTGIGGGVAIPHVKADYIAETVTALGVARSKIDFNAVDGEKCDIFFLLVSNPAAAERHLALLRWLSKLVRNPDFCRFMRSAKSPQDAVQLLQEMGE